MSTENMAIVLREVEVQRSPTPAEMFDQYFGPALFTPWARVLLEYAAPRPGERVLDLACGTGTIARHVAPLLGSEATSCHTPEGTRGRRHQPHR